MSIPLQPGDFSHVSSEDDNLKKLILEEEDKDSFTAVVINGIASCHIPYLKLCVKEWTRQLAYVKCYQLYYKLHFQGHI